MKTRHHPSITYFVLCIVFAASHLSIWADQFDARKVLASPRLDAYYLRAGRFSLGGYADAEEIRETIDELYTLATEPDLAVPALALICHLRRRTGPPSDYLDDVCALVAELETMVTVPSQITSILMIRGLIIPYLPGGETIKEGHLEKLKERLLEQHPRPDTFHAMLFHSAALRKTATGEKEKAYREELARYLKACGTEMVAPSMFDNETIMGTLRSNVRQWIGKEVDSDVLEENVRDFIKATASMYFPLGYIPQQQNRFQEAIPLLQTYLDVFGDYADGTELQRAYISLARCLKSTALELNDQGIKKRFESLATEYSDKFGENGIFSQEMNRYQEEIQKINAAK